ncbi:MAG: CoA transferase, partial [Burkholderiaceae bacterium]|nr:CoA transferase [Burkholderiaceae bacterium]
RNQNVRALYGHLAEIARSKTTAEWMEICDRLDVPATPIYSLDELPNHPHLKAVEFLQTAHMPGQGTIRYVRPPVRFMGSPAQVRSFAPLLGEHSAQVLGEAGFSGAEIDALTAEGVIKQTPSAV